MVEGAKQLNFLSYVIEPVNLGLLNGLDGILFTGRSVETLTDASVASCTKDGGVNVVVVKEVTITICNEAAAREIDVQV